MADAATDLAAANVATEALKTTVAEKETELGEEKAKNATLTTTVTTLEGKGAIFFFSVLTYFFQRKF